MTIRGTDAELVERIARLDDDALREAFQAHAGAVYRIARTTGASSALAEEVTQDAFVRLWQLPAAYDASRGTLRTFLVTHARHRAVDRLRSETARVGREQRHSRPEASAELDPESTLLATDAASQLRRLIAGLPKDTGEAIALAYFHGLTYRQVADRLGQPEGSVKSRIRNGLLRLREQLGADLLVAEAV